MGTGAPECKVMQPSVQNIIHAEPMTEKFEQELQKLIYQKVAPEAQKSRDKGTEIYEKRFGKLTKIVPLG